MPQRRHLIIGCGSAALSALEAIRRVNQEDRVKLVTREAWPPYSPTSLPYLLARRIQEDQLWMRDDAYFARMGATVEKGREVAALRPQDKEVVYRDGAAEGYDTLLIASGADPVKPPIPGLEEAFLPFRTFDDYRRLDGLLRERAGVAILGGGLVGVEVAAAALERGHPATIIEKEPRLLPLYFDEEASGHIRAIFEEEGARVLTGAEVTGVRWRGRKVEVEMAGGQALTTDVLVTAVGVRPALSFLDGSGIRVDRGILVDRRMRASAPDIYAAGDVAQAPSFFSGAPEINAILPSAAEQGRVAGANMAGGEEEAEGDISMNVFHFFGHKAVSVGDTSSRDGVEVLRGGDTSRRQYTKFAFQEGRLKGAALLDVEVDPGVLLYLIARRVPLASHQEKLARRPRDISRWLMLEAEKRETQAQEI